MDKVLVVGLLIVASVITATILFVVFRTSIEESRGSAVGLQEQASERAQTGLALVEVIPGNDGSKVDLWVKNIGVIDIQPIRNIDLFLVDIDGDRGGYLRYSEIGPAFMEDTWSVVGPFNERLRPGETIQLHADLFRNPLTIGEYLFTVSTPSDVSATTLFSADPNAPPPPQPPPPPPPILPFTLVTDVLPTGAGIVVGAGVYRAGITVPVTATRNPGFRFDNWSGDCVGTGRCNVFMDADKAVTANFSRSEFTLITNALPAVGGAVAGSGTYQIGRVVPVTQVANAGFTFDNWSGDCVGTAQCNVTMDSDKSVTANYSGRLFTLTATPAPIAGGTVTGGGTYAMGAVRRVTQVVNAGFTFDNWSGDCSGTGPCIVTMDQDKDVEANYSAAAPPPQPPAGCNPTPPGAVPVLNSITMSSGYPRQMLAVDGDTGGARVIWGAGSGTETIIETGQGGTRYFQIPETAQPGQHPVAIRAGANTSNIVCVTVRAVSGAFPAPRIEDIGLNGRTGSDVAMTISAANLDADATFTVNGTPVPARYLSSALPVAYQLSHIPATFGYPIYHYAQIRGIVSNPAIGSTLNVTVTNTDGQSDSKNYTLPPRWEELDSDGDGLLDTWEDSGYTRPGGGTVNLPAMGTTKYKKDLLLETDWIAATAPGVANWDNGVFPSLVSVFANGPVLNPDGTTGVRLIVDHGQGGAFTEGGDIMTPNHVTTGYEATCPDPIRCGNGYVSFHDYKNNYFNPDRLGLFHYYIMARNHWRPIGGSAEFPDGNLRGDDVLCIAQDGNAANFECIAHELGHNLGLAHGGLIGPPSAALFDHTNGSPNLYSIMNYSYSYGGVPTGCTAPTWSFSRRWGWLQDPAGGPATFSEGIRMPLVEANINENTGVCDNIPWDLNKAEFRGDARGDGQYTVGPLDVVDAFGELLMEFWDGTRATARDYDQWGNMILDFRTCWTENKGTPRRPRC